jgi:hypothetical protein
MSTISNIGGEERDPVKYNPLYEGVPEDKP